jgi:predicted nucleotidyltransferase
MNPQIQIDRSKIEDFCKKWKITELSFFGSSLRDDFRPESDIDILVAFEPNAPWDVFDHIHMEEKLAEIFDRKVDLVERKAVEASRNYIRRAHILQSVEPYYVA